MKKIIYSFILFLVIFLPEAKAQILSTANKPSQVYPGSGLPDGPSVYGFFAGRTPCQELSKELDMEINADCTKRKMALTLYMDPVSRKPTMYEIRGLGKWSGKGKWHISKGTPTDANATVLQIMLDTNRSFYLLKGDENVLFILDNNKNFLTGNAKYSYTMNRGRN